ncbi:MAG: hypothetical protein Q9227_008883 [Pyrenula ochraceoflavens]
MSKPTLLVIQGIFQRRLVYEPMSDGLKARGYSVVHPSLPSCTDPEGPSFASLTLIDDALAVRMALIRLVECEEKDVLVVMHSYGGLVGSEAVSSDLSQTERQRRGLKGGVVHLFFFNAFVLPVGQSVISAFGESPNNDVKNNGTFTMRDGARNLYGDLSASEQAIWEPLMIAAPYGIQLTKMTRAAYEYVPSTYLIGEGDQAALPLYQEMFANQIKANIERGPWGHSPMLSHLEPLMAAIDRCVTKVNQEA